MPYLILPTKIQTCLFQTPKSTQITSNLQDSVSEDSAATTQIHVDKDASIASMEKMIVGFQALESNDKLTLDTREASAKLKLDKAEHKTVTRTPHLQGVSFDILSLVSGVNHFLRRLKELSRVFHRKITTMKLT